VLAVPELRLPHPFGFPFDYAQGFGKTGQALAFLQGWDFKSSLLAGWHMRNFITAISAH